MHLSRAFFRCFSNDKVYAAGKMEIRPRRVVLIAVLSAAVLTWLLCVFWGASVLVKRGIQNSAGAGPVHHRSEEEARAYLKHAEGQLARMPDGTPKDSGAELLEISANVYDIAREYPDIPSVWRVAGMAIDKRFGGTKQNTSGARCGTDPGKVLRSGPTDRFETAEFVTYQDCTIDLDGMIHGRDEEAGPAAGKPTPQILELHNVHVIYRGGRLQHMDTLACVDCTFDIQVNQDPPGPGRSLVRGVLQAGSENFSVIISDK